jgi:hypothetical protein
MQGNECIVAIVSEFSRNILEHTINYLKDGAESLKHPDWKGFF